MAIVIVIPSRFTLRELKVTTSLGTKSNEAFAAEKMLNCVVTQSVLQLTASKLAAEAGIFGGSVACMTQARPPNNTTRAAASRVLP